MGTVKMSSFLPRRNQGCGILSLPCRGPQISEGHWDGCLCCCLPLLCPAICTNVIYVFNTNSKCMAQLMTKATVCQDACGNCEFPLVWKGVFSQMEPTRSLLNEVTADQLKPRSTCLGTWLTQSRNTVEMKAIPQGGNRRCWWNRACADHGGGVLVSSMGWVWGGCPLKSKTEETSWACFLSVETASGRKNIM